ncbi:MAG: hypothetical protein JXR68_05925 [Bacteroidales bacterium]|nr:hypothetical protein [Bacteroidales bacterium]
MKKITVFLAILIISKSLDAEQFNKGVCIQSLSMSEILIQDSSYYFLGFKDAMLYYNMDIPHAIFGFVLGGFAVLGVALTSSPEPYFNAKTIKYSKNSNLFYNKDYIAGYRKAARKKNIRATFLGWSIWTMLFIFVILS